MGTSKFFVTGLCLGKIRRKKANTPQVQLVLHASG